MKLSCHHEVRCPGPLSKWWCRLAMGETDPAVDASWHGAHFLWLAVWVCRAGRKKRCESQLTIVGSAQDQRAKDGGNSWKRGAVFILGINEYVHHFTEQWMSPVGDLGHMKALLYLTCGRGRCALPNANFLSHEARCTRRELRKRGTFFFFLPMKTWIQFNRNQIQKYGLSLCPLTEYHPGEIVEVATGVREEGRQEGREEGKRGCWGILSAHALSPLSSPQSGVILQKRKRTLADVVTGRVRWMLVVSFSCPVPEFLLIFWEFLTSWCFSMRTGQETRFLLLTWKVLDAHLPRTPAVMCPRPW